LFHVLPRIDNALQVGLLNFDAGDLSVVPDTTRTNPEVSKHLFGPFNL
jgi:hypothetical protein